MSNYRICWIYYNSNALSGAYTGTDASSSSGVDTRSYNEMLHDHFANYSIYGDDFSRTMNRLGNPCIDILPYALPMQQRWAEESGLDIDARREGHMIVLAQLRQFEPDVIYFQGVNAAVPFLALPLKEFVPSLKIIAGHCGCVFPVEQSRSIDLLFCCIPTITKYFIERGKPAETLYHAFGAGVLPALNARLSELPPLGNTFLGSTGFGSVNLRVRYLTLLYLMLATDLQIWGFEQGVNELGYTADVREGLGRLLNWIAEARSPDEGFTRLVRFMTESNLMEPPNQLPFRWIFPERVKRPMFGLDYYAAMRQSNSTVNVTTEWAEGESGNLRLFEATGAGACLVTEMGSNLAELFDPDREVVTYSSREECAEKIRWLSGNPETARRIGEAGQRRALRDHTTAARCEVLDRRFHEQLRRG